MRASTADVEDYRFGGFGTNPAERWPSCFAIEVLYFCREVGGGEDGEVGLVSWEGGWTEVVIGCDLSIVFFLSSLSFCVERIGNVLHVDFFF